MLKDEHNKNGKLYQKSMEMVRKYNSELKYINESHIETSNNKEKLKLANLVSIETQTEPGEEPYLNPKNDLELFKNKLLCIKILLDGENSDQSSSSDLNGLLNEIEVVAKRVRNDQTNKTNEIKHLKEVTARLEADLKTAKETKQKLESLYKIKCKSDLNKSAQIKKLEISYQTELIKFRNEYNSDVVRYLENKLAMKDSMLSENLNKLNRLLSLISSEQSQNLKPKLDKLKESIQGLVSSNLFSNSSSNTIDLNTQQGQSNCLNDNLNLNNIYKRIPLNLMINKDFIDFSNSIKVILNEHFFLILVSQITINIEKKIEQTQNDTTQFPIQNFGADKDFTLNKTIQDEMLELDKQLNDMKILSNSLIVRF